MPFTDPVLIFASVMVLILLSPIVARRLHLPDIIGLIVAGMVFGEHGLGLLARDDTMKLLGQVGLLFIMFLAGLEIDLHQARKHRLHSIGFGLLTFLLPLGLGVAGGTRLLGLALPTALLLASMFSSHTLLTFPALGKLQLAKSRAATTTIGGTIITDTLALLILAVIAASVHGNLGSAFWVGLGLRIGVYTVAVVLFVPVIGRWFLRHFSDDDNLDFIAVLAIAFSVSYLAHLAGLEPIIGAFLAGMTLNSLIPEKGTLMRKLHFVGNALFIPFFLLTIGMLVNLELLWQGPEVWLIMAVMVVVALLSKWLAAAGFSRLFGYSGDECGVIYGLSVNQAAATLAAALVGYDLGLFNDGIITGTIAMIGVTCFAGPLLTDRYGRRLAAAIRAERGSAEHGEYPHRIVIPVHSTSRDKEMLELAMFLRRDGSHEPLYPVNVVFEGPQAEAEIADREKLLDHLVMNSLAIDVPITPLVVIDTNIAGGILRVAREKRISILSMFWDGEIHGYPRRFGRTLDRVIDNSGQLLLISRLRHPLSTARRIVLLCPPQSEYLPEVREAAGVIKTIARQSGARLLLLLPGGQRDGGMHAVFASCKPEMNLSVQTYADWRRVREALAALVTDHDWVMVLMARLGQIAWQPLLDRLPRQLAPQLPDYNLSFVYPPVEMPEPALLEPVAEPVAVETELARVLRPGHVALQMEEGDIRSLLRALLEPALRQRGQQAGRLAESLAAIAELEPVELLPGLLLLHEHCPEVEESEFYLASCRRPLSLPALSTPCRALLILLDPLEQEPAAHLAALNTIAHLVKLPNFMAMALTAVSGDELLRALQAVIPERPAGGQAGTPARNAGVDRGIMPQ